MFKEYSPMQYIAIDVANQQGLDKLTYEDRLDWVKSNLDRLEEHTEQAEKPYLYAKSVRALRKALKGEAIGHAVSLDAVCSGMQVMSAVMACEQGCSITGLVHENVRSDAYTSVTEAMNETMPIEVSRKDAKDAVMTSLYGSTKVPRDIFGEELLPLFYSTMEKVAPGAMKLLALLRAAWNPEADVNTWSLPDGHMAVVPVTEVVEKRICIAELKYTPVIEVEMVMPKEKGISLIANVVHSIDAYVLRTLVRRCNYIPRDVNRMYAMLKTTVKSTDYESEYVRIYRETNMVDMTMLNASETEVAGFPTAMRLKLLRMLNICKEHKPFEIITVHDDFASLPNNTTQMRRVYADIMGDLVESTLIDDILDQLYGDRDTVEKMNNPTLLAAKVRQSNYGIS